MSGTKSPVFVLVLLYLAYGGFLTATSLSGFPATLQDGRFFPYLADKPVGEDGFYMLTVAWNLADGRGLVYNFDAPTTGIQPLSTAIFAVLAFLIRLLGGTKWTFVRTVLGFGVLNHLVLSHIVGVITVRLAAGTPAGVGSVLPYYRRPEYALGLSITLFNFGLFRWCTYGLETGIYLTLFGLSILYVLALPEKRLSPKSAVVLGGLAGITAWARIDFGVVLAVFLVWIAIRYGLSRALIAGATALATIGPWLAYLVITSGTFIPSSGAAQAKFATLVELKTRLWIMGKVILGCLVPWIYSSGSGLTDLMALVLFVAFMMTVCRAAGLRVAEKVFASAPSAGAWLLGVTALLVVYVVGFWATHFYTRYASPLLVISSATIAVVVGTRIERAGPRMLSVTLCAGATVFFGWCIVSLHSGRIGNQHVISAAYIQANFPAERVGAFQSGVIGFFNENVLNLDGKVSQEALKAIRRGTLAEYIEFEKVSVLIDWPESLKEVDSEYLRDRWRPCAQQVRNQSVCLERRPPS